MLRKILIGGRAEAAPAVMMLVVLAAALTAGAGLAATTRGPGDDAAAARAAWLLQRGDLQADAVAGLPRLGAGVGGDAMATDDIGGTAAVAASGADDKGGGSGRGALPVLASLVLPGSGEVMLGHKRGFVMMALDIFAWSQVSKYHSRGKDKSNEYYAFADAHYSDDLLLAAYVPGGAATDDFYRADVGTDYFDFETISTLADLDKLPLYVTVQEDRREYYENLGKWDQFVFGWDDFMRPDDYATLHPEYTPTGNPKVDLEQPWISANRDTYRLMRDASNDAYKTRDRWLYVNVGLRLVSVVETAWLGGLLGGDDRAAGDDRVSVAGHDVRLVAQPFGLYRGVVAATVSF